MARLPANPCFLCAPAFSFGLQSGEQGGARDKNTPPLPTAFRHRIKMAAVLKRAYRKLRPVLEAGFMQNTRYVITDRSGFKPQFLRDLFVCETGGDAVNDEPLDTFEFRHVFGNN
jgi:hypothetical protein